MRRRPTTLILLIFMAIIPSMLFIGCHENTKQTAKNVFVINK